MAETEAFQCSWGAPVPSLAIFDTAEAAQASATATARATGGAHNNDDHERRGEGKGGVVEPAAPVLLTDGKAPWVELRVRRKLTHVAILSNARVVEFHVGGSEVQTHEGVSVAASGEAGFNTRAAGLGEGARYLHFIDCCVAASEAVRLKFFARKPKGEICVVAVCVSGIEEMLPPEPSQSSDGCARGGGETASGSQMDALEARVQQLELMVKMTVGTVVRRLNDMETRLSAIEEKSRS